MRNFFYWTKNHEYDWTNIVTMWILFVHFCKSHEWILNWTYIYIYIIWWWTEFRTLFFDDFMLFSLYWYVWFLNEIVCICVRIWRVLIIGKCTKLLLCLENLCNLKFYIVMKDDEPCAFFIMNCVLRMHFAIAI